MALIASACSSDDGDGGGGGGGGATARGVTGETIKIGVAIPDLGNLGSVSKNFDIGDVEQQIEAILDGWRRDERLPVHGRDIEVVFKGYNIFSSDQQVAVCNELVRDESVFAVVGLRFFNAGAECVASEQQTPVITLDGAAASVYERGAPYFFTVRYSRTTMFRNWVHWAHEEGILEGRKIGVYYESELQDLVDGAVEPTLQELGYELTEKVDAGSGEGVGGGAQDSVAVQRFKSAGVEVLLPMIGSTQYVSVMQQAESLDYHPTYIDNDFGDHTSDAGASIFIPDQFDGTQAMTGKRVGQFASGADIPDVTRECVENYERYAATEVPLESPESAELDTILAGCDDMAVLLAGLENAGEELTFDSFVAGLETIEGLELAGHGDVTYSSTRHEGVGQQRTVTWSADCRCWAAEGDFSDLAAP